MTKQDYQAYLRSEHWQKLRKRKLKEALYRCQLCNNGDTSLHVHHRTYARLGKELSVDLIVLCADCHAKFHDKIPKIPKQKSKTNGNKNGQSKNRRSDRRTSQPNGGRRAIRTNKTKISTSNKSHRNSRN